MFICLFDEEARVGALRCSYEPAGADVSDRQRILNNVCAHLPSLRQAEILEDWVGYRPGRPSVRLELSEWASRPVVHSYGDTPTGGWAVHIISPNRQIWLPGCACAVCVNFCVHSKLRVYRVGRHHSATSR